MRPFLRPLTVLGTLAFAGSLVLTGCTTTTETTSTSSTASGSDSTTAEATSVSYVDITDLTELSYEDLGIADFDVETSGSRAVTLADGASTSAQGVTVDGDTITITEGGVYLLSGTLTAGQVIVDAGEDDVTIILDGVNITAPSVGALLVTNADDVQIYLATGSTNTLSDAAGATVEESTDTETDAPNATLYSTADLWIGGSGALVVNGIAEDGITSKDSLVLDGGNITVTATDDGIRGKDHLVILSGDVTVNAGGDGLRSDNEDGGTDAAAAVGVIWIEGGTIDVTAGDDGIQGYRQVTITDGDITVGAQDDGVHTEGFMRISDGSVTVTESYEGLEAAVMALSGGAIDVTSSDDGINVAGGPGVTSGGGEMGGMGSMPGGGGGRSGDTTTSDAASTETTGDSGATTTTATTYVTTSYTTTAVAASVQTAGGGFAEDADSGRYLEISGGTIIVNAEGDGIDVGGTMTQTGGDVVVAGPTGSGNGALDVDGTLLVTGGSLVAGGSSGMLVVPTSEGQGTLAITFSGTVPADTRITVFNADGDVVASFQSPKSFQSLVLTTPDIVSGETYTVSTGGTISGGEEVGYVTFGGSDSGSESLGTLDAS